MPDGNKKVTHTLLPPGTKGLNREVYKEKEKLRYRERGFKVLFPREVLVWICLYIELSIKHPKSKVNFTRSISPVTPGVH